MLGDVFVLAEKLQDVKAKNTILKAIKNVASVEQNLSTYIRMASKIYDGTPRTSRARAFVVELLGNSPHLEADQMDAPQGAADFGIMPADLAKDVILRLIWYRCDVRSEASTEDYLEDETAA
jgi:hypothetical protein